MLETIREFALERLDASGEEDALRRRAVPEPASRSPTAPARAASSTSAPWNFDLVAPEIDNVRAVLDWAARPRSVARPRARRRARVVLGRARPGGGRDVARAAARAARRTPIPTCARTALLRSCRLTRHLRRRPTVAEPCYRESLELFTACGDEDRGGATSGSGSRANMLMRGEADAAWPLLEAALEEFRARDMPLGEGQVLGVPRREGAPGGRPRALLRTVPRERRDRARGSVGRGGSWASSAAPPGLERELAAGSMPPRSSRRGRSQLAVEIGDRQHIVFAGAELAVIAAARGDGVRAGLLWGAVEAEAAHGRVGQWERERPEFEELVLRRRRSRVRATPAPRAACSRSPRRPASSPSPAG